MEALENMSDKKEKTITYTSKDCDHDHLIKVAPMWYICKNCPKIFMVPFSLQFTYEDAIKHLAKVAIGIKEREKLIKANEKKLTSKEKKEEIKAIKNYERNQKLSRNPKPRGN